MSERQFGDEAGTETRRALYKAVSLNLHSTVEIKIYLHPHFKGEKLVQGGEGTCQSPRVRMWAAEQIVKVTSLQLQNTRRFCFFFAASLRGVVDILASI